MRRDRRARGKKPSTVTTVFVGDAELTFRLLSCRTACPSGSFAQDLANQLGVRVMAPTTDIGASGSGKTLTVFEGGEWRWFNPN